MAQARQLPRSLFLLGIWLAVTGIDAVAEEGLPVRGALRELTTDRPDTTESPFTVDRDHVQLEMNVASYTRNRLDGVRTTEWDLAPFNLRYGVRTNLEAGIFVVRHLRVTEQARGASKRKTNGGGD